MTHNVWVIICISCQFYECKSESTAVNISIRAVYWYCGKIKVTYLVTSVLQFVNTVLSMPNFRLWWRHKRWRHEWKLISFDNFWKLFRLTIVSHVKFSSSTTFNHQLPGWTTSDTTELINMVRSICGNLSRKWGSS